VISEQDFSLLHNVVSQQIASYMQGYGLQVVPVITLFPFQSTQGGSALPQRAKTATQPLALVCTILVILGGAVATLLLFRTYKRPPPLEEEEALLHMMTTIDLTKLALSIQHKPPQQIAKLLSYLEPHRAEQMISALAPETQEAVLFHLSEMEREAE
jgi:uncharacterized membrane protein